MSVFSSTYSALIDDKGRVVLPAPYKKAMGSMADEKIVIEKGYYQNCLNIYPERIFSIKEQSIVSQLDETDEDDIELRDSFYENHTNVFMAENGRINIPAEFLKYIIDIKKSKEVVFVGSGDYVKLWAEDAYQGNKKTRPDIGTLFKQRKLKNQ
jgi:MraZ protein